MREINAARDLVRLSLELLAERPYTELSERENGSPAPAWWEDAIFEDPSGLGVRWNPGAVRIPWRQRFEQARLALCIAVGDTVTVEQRGRALARPRRGLRQLGARQPAHRLGRPAGRAAAHRRRGALPRRRASSPSTPPTCRAAGWHCPVCGRTSTLGEPRERPCPRCIRRSRIDYGRWDDLGRRWRRLHRKLRDLDRVATTFSPRRSPAFRDVDDGLADARSRVESLQRRRSPRSTPRSRPPRRASPSPSCARARTRTAGGAERRRRERARHAAEAKRVRTARDRTAALLDEQRVRVVELDRERTRLERELRARHESSERARLRGQAKRDADRDAALRELRTIEIELGAVAPDAIALLGGFEAWRQAPDKWLVEQPVH